MSSIIPTLVYLLALLPPTTSFHLPHQNSSIRHPGHAGRVAASPISRLDRSFNCRRGARANINISIEDEKDAMTPKSSQQQPSGLFWLSAACCFWYSPQLAIAAALPESFNSNNIQQVSRSPHSSLLLASYASEGSGGMPFLSTFQTPGAVPNPTSNDKEARNRAFDDAFDQDKADRDAYYAKMALASREKKMMELQARRAEIGLDAIDAGPRVGDSDVASMASLKQYLLQKDPATMTPAEFKEFQALKLQQREQEAPAERPLK